MTTILPHITLQTAKSRIAAMTEADDAKIRARREKAYAVATFHTPDGLSKMIDAQKRWWRLWRESHSNKKS